jgi:uncharacterized damage-inducible protein DinB
MTGSHDEAAVDGSADVVFDAVLEAVFDGWARHNRALVNLIRAIPAGGLSARVLPTSPTIGAMCTHMHHERMVSVLENAPEHAGEVPESEWAPETDVTRIAQQLEESCARVRDAVRARTTAGRALDLDFAHPVQLVLFLIFHEGYHHGQIKLALKATGAVVPDEVIGATVWDVWRSRGA